MLEHAANVDELFDEVRRYVRPPPRLSVSEWADRERQLSPESSAEPGQWRTSRAEYQREIMDAMSDPDIDSVVVESSAQIGKTEIVNNVVGYFVDQDPSPILVVQPTLEMGETWSKDRLAPMIRDTPALVGKIAEPNSRGSGNTLLHKSFAGGHITIAGANSSASLASRPIRVLLLDEVDRYPISAGTEGDPASLAIKRTATFWNKRILMTSSPTIKGASRIDTAFLASDRRRYFVPCPRCATMQVLYWKAVIWTESNPATARIECVACHALLDDSDRVDMIAKGKWRPTAPFTGIAGFHIWEAYSPWRALAEIVADFLAAKPYPETLKTWVNTALGEVWEDRLGEKIAGDSLASRADEYAQWTVPAGALMLTCGVDVQRDRLALTLWGYGPGEEAWTVAWDEIAGSPTDPATWGKLDDVLGRRYPHELGGEIGVMATCVDAGDGVTMNDVLDYTRVYRPFEDRRSSVRRVLAIKGQSQDGKPVIGRAIRVEVNRSGGAEKHGALLWPVGSGAAKAWLMARLAQPGLVHFAAGLPEDFYQQLTSERLKTTFSRGIPKREWVKAPSARNEALDCTVYAYAAAIYAGLKRANWVRLKLRASTPAAIPGPEQGDPTPPATEARIVPFHPPRQRIPGGFVNGWRR